MFWLPQTWAPRNAQAASRGGHLWACSGCYGGSCSGLLVGAHGAQCEVRSTCNTASADLLAGSLEPSQFGWSSHLTQKGNSRLQHYKACPSAATRFLLRLYLVSSSCWRKRPGHSDRVGLGGKAHRVQGSACTVPLNPLNPFRSRSASFAATNFPHLMIKPK
jgi:hypothetical protein